MLVVGVPSKFAELLGLSVGEQTVLVEGRTFGIASRTGARGNDQLKRVVARIIGVFGGGPNGVIETDLGWPKDACRVAAFLEPPRFQRSMKVAGVDRKDLPGLCSDNADSKRFVINAGRERLSSMEITVGPVARCRLVIGVFEHFSDAPVLRALTVGTFRRLGTWVSQVTPTDAGRIDKHGLVVAVKCEDDLKGDRLTE